ncbi:uncharacterized protein LOC106666540 isoform X2 [Cimex lectularius]|uniref:CPR type cuticle protein n=1 Tax=Cimex lectularius TaxID=79782 RepID=A0A8I6SJL1_CIMLE|nr:uncharacterized protein LOC106666540 isoform X2 [Cimex lectularius]
MRVTIILFTIFGASLAFFVPAPLGKDGVVVDTAEVAVQKLEQYKSLAKAGGAVPFDAQHTLNGYEQKYHGPPAPLNHDGTVDETPEVKHVKAERLAALSEAFAKASHGYEDHQQGEGYDQRQGNHDFRYHGPPAPLNHDGTVAETPEVKHVKAARLAVLSEAFAKAPKDDHHHMFKRSPFFGLEQVEMGHYHGPPAPLNHDGTVAETPEVKHVKAERLAALFEAFAKAPRGNEEHQHEMKYEQTHENDVFKYHGPPAPLNHDGTVAETPEVKHIKAARLAALSEAFAKASNSYKGHQHEERYEQPQENHEFRYHGPPAPLNHDGTVAETPEVKHVKAARLAALSEAFAKAPKDEHHNMFKRSPFFGLEQVQSGHYHGPPAPLNHDGTVAETPEVKHVKAERLAALAEAFANAPRGHEELQHGHEQPQEDHEFRYHGPPAPLNHDGTVAETPEVKHVKAARLAALSDAFAKASHGYKGHQQADRYEQPQHNHEFRYHGPPAPLNHDGTVDETPEVKHVKAARLAALSEAFVKAQNDEHHHKLYKRSPLFAFEQVESGHYHGPPAPLNHDGTVAETPEVKHVKAERLAALAEAFAKAPQGLEEHQHGLKYEQHHENQEFMYHGPPAPLNHDGTVAETPEVKHVKAARLAALSEAFAKDSHGYKGHQHEERYEPPQKNHEFRYHGPPAPLNHDGTVDETPEVKHVKAARLAALSEAFVKAQNDEHQHRLFKRSPSFAFEQVNSGHYHGPPAPLNHDGTVADTPEVKHVKAERLAALAEAFAKAPQGLEEHQGRLKYEHHHENQEFRYHGPPAPLNHDGTVAETPEVQHVKAARLAALSEAFAKASHVYEGHKQEERYEQPHENHEFRYHGPPAPLNHDGTVDETPEVKHVKAARLAALSEAFAKAPKDEHHNMFKRSPFFGLEQVQSGHYHGPPAPLNHDGTVAETPEVKHVKAERLAALAEAFANAPRGHEELQHGHEQPQEDHEFRYHGPPAPLNHDGTVAETPEVKHVKAARLAALSEAFAKASHGYKGHKQEERYEQPHENHKFRYHGPPAPLNPDGTVAETTEVKHVKAARLDTLSEAFAKARKDEHHHSDSEHLAAHHKTLVYLW